MGVGCIVFIFQVGDKNFFVLVRKIYVTSHYKINNKEGENMDSLIYL